MIEEKLQRRLRRAVIVISCIIAALLVFGVCFAAFLRQAETEAVREQIIAEAEEYKSRILKQIDADFQTLATLAAFIERDSVSDRELLARRLKKANENNTFLTMTYYDTAGEGILTASGKETVTDASLSGSVAGRTESGAGSSVREPVGFQTVSERYFRRESFCIQCAGL